MIQRKRKQSEVENKTTRFYSKKQESDVAKSLGGVRQPNSGATPFKKSDVVLEDFAIECKTKTKQSDSMTIHRSWLEKNEYEALFMGKKNSALVFDFGIGTKRYVVISEELFKELLEQKNNGGM